MNTTLESLLENPEKPMTAIIKRIASDSELSKSFSSEEARAAMLLVLDGLADPVQAVVFLIGLRVKRETEDENKVLLQATLNRTRIIEAEVDELVDIADP